MKDNVTPLHAHTPGEERPTHNQGVVLLMKTIVEEGEERAHQKLGEDLQGYLVFTLVRFLHGKDPFEVTLALEFLRAEAMERGRQKEESLLGSVTPPSSSTDFSLSGQTSSRYREVIFVTSARVHSPISQKCFA